MSLLTPSLIFHSNFDKKNKHPPINNHALKCNPTSNIQRVSESNFSTFAPPFIRKWEAGKNKRIPFVIT